MARFAPLLVRAALCASPALLLATGSAAIAQGSAAPILIGTSATVESTAYGNAARAASTLLAGGMSRLAAISAQQGDSSSSWSAAAIASGAVVNRTRLGSSLGNLPGWNLQGIRLTLQQPISYRQPDLMPAFMRDLVATPAPRTAAVFLNQPAAPSPQTLARPYQPDVFGSVAMAVSRTSLDAKWSAIAQPIAGKGPWNGILSAARTMNSEARVEAINRWVNQRLRFVDDRSGGDSWVSAPRALLRGAGDCEDYAIAKMKLLEASGLDRRALFLVIARDLVRQADHAVLAVQVGEELMILDNMTDRVLPSSTVADYRPIMSFNAFGRWTHGYRVKTVQPVQFAAR